MRGPFLFFISLACVFYIIIVLEIAYMIKNSAIMCSSILWQPMEKNTILFFYSVPHKLQIDRFRRSL